MKLTLNTPYIIAFLLLTLVMLELHEMVHIIVGWFICGCWGERDFNVWELCSSCSNSESLGWMATLAGPLFSFILIWIGTFWLSSSNEIKKYTGFALIFANIPFGRITTVMQGGGDEMVVIRHFLSGRFSRTELISFGSILLLLAGVPPIVKAYKTITNKHAWAYITGFLTAPLAFILVYVLIFLNSVLNSGFLAQPWILGTPALITVHTAAAASGLYLMRKRLL